MRTATTNVIPAFLLVSLLLGGCVGDSAPNREEGPAISQSGSVESTQESAAPAQADEGTGAVEGRVVNENQAPIAKAFVVLVGSSNSTRTDAGGRFSLNHVEPGRYLLRVDAETYRPLESAVEVLAATVTRINITLVPMVDRGAGFREHLHDLWGDETERTLFEGPLNFERSIASGGSQNAQQFCGPSVSSGTCPNRIEIRLPDGVIVYPGTKELRVTVSWQSEYVASNAFRFIPANETKFLRAPLALANDEAILVPLEYPMTDHGHQTYTLWTMEIGPEIRIGDTKVSQGDFDRRMVGPFQVSVVAVKGVVPPEPAHPMFWTNSSRLQLVDRLEKTYTSFPIPSARNPKAVACASPESGAATCMVLPAGTIVPPGTTRLEVTFETVYGTPALASAFSEKTVTFRTASVNPKEADFDDLKVVAPAKKEGTKLTFDLKLESIDPDAFYQRKSLWMFSLANAGSERGEDFTSECYSVGCGGTKFYLSVVAINDDFAPGLRSSG